MSVNWSLVFKFVESTRAKLVSDQTDHELFNGSEIISSTVKFMPRFP